MATIHVRYEGGPCDGLEFDVDEATTQLKPLSRVSGRSYLRTDVGPGAVLYRVVGRHAGLGAP